MLELEKKFKSKAGELEAKAKMRNLGFLELNDLKRKFMSAKVSMQDPKKPKLKDLDIDTYGMVIEAMTITISEITVNGKTAFGEELKDHTIKITEMNTWNDVPREVGEWLGEVVLDKFFRDEEEPDDDVPGGAGVGHQDPPMQ